ncbi:hypothetical protein [Amycolatopsis camponoti]|uniref:hypothetical protein n=1 Tax=Amycolatopsis camponoti TaxID=2606593 RepID=UPI0012D775E8|nr:hypothetical protein [Amycolatopsis camponoti]
MAIVEPAPATIGRGQPQLRRRPQPTGAERDQDAAPAARPRSQSPGHRLPLHAVSNKVGSGDYDQVSAVEQSRDDGRECVSRVRNEDEPVQRHADLAGGEQADIWHPNHRGPTTFGRGCRQQS